MSFVPAASLCVWNHRLDCKETPEPESSQTCVKTNPHTSYTNHMALRVTVLSSVSVTYTFLKASAITATKRKRFTAALLSGASLNPSRLSFRSLPSLLTTKAAFTPRTMRRFFFFYGEPLIASKCRHRVDACVVSLRRGRAHVSYMCAVRI